MNPPRGSRRLVPPYVATGGRASGGHETLDRLSLLTLSEKAEDEQALSAPQRRVTAYLAGGSLTLAEVAAYARLPVPVARVLVCELIDTGLVHARDPIPTATQHDRTFLERVLDGLRAIRTE